MPLLEIVTVLFLAFYVVFVSYTMKGLRRLKAPQASKVQPVVQVSVIIPFRNERNNLPLLMSCLDMQDYPRENFEVIFVDDHSDDGGAEFLQKAPSASKLNISVLRLDESRQSKKAAISAGIRSAKGQLILTTDADATMMATWLSTIAGFYAERGPVMILGPVKISAGSTLFGRLQSIEFLSLQLVTAAFAANRNPILNNGANLAYEKSAFDLSGGYGTTPQPASGDDFFLLQELRKLKDREILFLAKPGAAVTVKAAPGLGEFLQQRMRWASKTRFARSRSVQITAIYNTSLSFWIFILLLAGIVFNHLPLLTIFFLAFKFLLDLLLLRKSGKILGQSFSVPDFAITFALYPIYICSIFILTLLAKSNWKGRKV